MRMKLTGWMWDLREREMKDDCKFLALVIGRKEWPLIEMLKAIEGRLGFKHIHLIASWTFW